MKLWNVIIICGIKTINFEPLPGFHFLAQFEFNHKMDEWSYIQLSVVKSLIHSKVQPLHRWGWGMKK